MTDKKGAEVAAGSSPNETDDNTNANPWQLSATLKIPPFWASRPNLWFLQVETQFRLKGITSSNTKYDYLIAALPAESMEIVADFLTNPTEGDKYENIKKLLISRCQDTEERRLDALLNRIELGDLKPSELFRQMENLAGGNSLVNKSLLNKLWLNKLPPSIQPCIIAIESTHEQADLFKIADRIFDSTDRPKIAAVQSKQQNANDSDIKQLLTHLSDRIKQLELRQSRPTTRNNSAHRRSFSQSRSRSETNSKNDFCWYHRRFGNKSNKCLPGCTYNKKTENRDKKN